MKNSVKSKYVSSAFILMLASLIVKLVSAFYKIPLTHFIGATGRGYFACAYNLFMPIHIITMGSLPIALSQLVSRYYANNNLTMLKALKVSANRLFFVVGFIGTLIVILFSYPYCIYIAKSPNSIYTVLAIAPVVLFSTMSASYRGFFEGYLNMVPTSVSQTIDVLFKAVFGLLFAKLSMAFLYNSYINQTLCIFSGINDETEALNIIYPLTTAFSMLGVSLGSIASYIYLVYYSKSHYKNNLKLNNRAISIASKKLFNFSLSIMLSCIVQSIFQFIDTASIQIAINKLSIENLKNILKIPLKYVNISNENIYTYFYGLFNSALDFKNIIPGITMAIGVCAVPAISSFFNTKDSNKLNNISNLIFKYTSMLSTFMGAFIGLESYNILSLFYKGNIDIVEGSYKLVSYFAFTSFVYCIASTSVFCVQAIGEPKRSILPFTISGIIRCALNILFISNPTLNLFGAVVSGFIGYLIIAILNIRIFIKNSNVKLSISKSFLRPVLVIILVVALYRIALKSIVLANDSYAILVLKAIIFIVIYLVCAIIFQIFDVKEVILLINCKKHR